MLYRLKVFAVCAALGMAACSSNDAAPAPESSSSAPSAAPVAGAPISTRPRIVFLGDSLTAGYGLDVEQSVPSLVQKQLDAEGYKFEVVNAGVSGDTSAGGCVGWIGRSMETCEFSSSSLAPMMDYVDFRLLR
jgi:acyl-CoA thioesterase-1